MKVSTLIIVTFLATCSQKKQQKDVTTNPTLEYKQSFDDSCFEGRAVTDELLSTKATIVYVANSYMFTTESKRWQPCNVPEEFQREGLKVVVSGDVLEIRPNERRAGTPFRIKSLSIDTSK